MTCITVASEISSIARFQTARAYSSSSADHWIRRSAFVGRPVQLDLDLVFLDRVGEPFPVCDGNFAGAH
jgi:hypothetical protein